MAYPHSWVNGSGQPISAAALEEIEAEIDTKAPLASPTFTGTVTLPAGAVTAAMVAADVATQAELDAAVAPTITANTQTGSYTLVLGDAGKVVEMNVAGANTLTVPPNASVAFPIGTVLEVFQYGAGQTTITPGAAVTIVSSGAKLKTTGQYSSASLRKRATNEWVAAGDLSA